MLILYLIGFRGIFLGLPVCHLEKSPTTELDGFVCEAWEVL